MFWKRVRVAFNYWLNGRSWRDAWDLAGIFINVLRSRKMRRVL